MHVLALYKEWFSQLQHIGIQRLGDNDNRREAALPLACDFVSERDLTLLAD
jgi:hypothetical protein